MNFWQIILIVCAALLVLITFAAVIEMKIFIEPKSIWANLIANIKINPKPTSCEQLASYENAKKAKEEASLWLAQEDWEDKNIVSFDNLNLHAKIHMAKEQSHNWVICIHGYSGTICHSATYGIKYFEKGFNVVLPEARCHGESQGKYIGMGWLERYDILYWIEEIIKRDTNANIVLHGESMGAATVMMVTGENLPVQVKCAVEDCGYSAVWNQFTYNKKCILKIKNPPMMAYISLLAKIFAHYDFKSASSVNQLKKSKTPTLFIHGEDDKFVPFSDLDLCYEAASCPKDKYTVPYAGHCQSEYVDVEKYWQKVFEFVNKFLHS